MIVRSIDSFQCYEWLMYKHYARRIPSISYSFGLYIDDVLQGVLTIGKPASNPLCVGVCGEKYSEYVYELNRVCINDGLPKNTASRFISAVLRQLKESMVLVSYADTKMGHKGYIYQATNWIYTGATKERTDIGSEDGTHSRHYDKNQDYSLNRKHRSSKHRYIYFLGRMKKEFRSNLKYTVEQYPKGDNKYYDASHKVQPQITLF